MNTDESNVVVAFLFTTIDLFVRRQRKKGKNDQFG